MAICDVLTVVVIIPKAGGLVDSSADTLLVKVMVAMVVPTCYRCWEDTFPPRSGNGLNSAAGDKGTCGVASCTDSCEVPACTVDNITMVFVGTISVWSVAPV